MTNPSQSSSPLRVIYAGTPAFAVPALQNLIQAGHQIVLVLTQPDRPAGRGMKLTASPVKLVAEQYGLPIAQPETLKLPAIQQQIQALQADIMVVAAYGLIIPQAVLDMPKWGCINIHASLLPRWRGAAPIQRAIQAGDEATGVTIMKVVAALDAGDMLVKTHTPILPHDTAASIHDKLAQQGADSLLQVMQMYASQGQMVGQVQDPELVTYAEKLQKSEALIDWQHTAEQLSRQIRAFNPFPVAYSLLHGEPCKFWMATAVQAPISQPAGTVLALGDTIDIACGQGILKVESLQMPGAKRLTAKAFCAGYGIKVGTRFGEAVRTEQT